MSHDHDHASALAALLASAVKKAEKDLSLLPEAAVITLRESATRYISGCPFRPMDLVTPRRGTNFKGAGQPHIVIETRAEPIWAFELSNAIDSTSPSYGRRLDVRVMCFVHGDQMCFWMESWTLEPWTEGMSVESEE